MMNRMGTMNPVIDVSAHADADDAASAVSSLSESYRSGGRSLDHHINHMETFAATSISSGSGFQSSHKDENDINFSAAKRTAQHQLQPTATGAPAGVHQLFDKHDVRGGMIDSSLDVDDIFGVPPYRFATSMVGGNDNYGRNDSNEATGSDNDSFADILRAEEGLYQPHNDQMVERKPTVRFQENVVIMKPKHDWVEEDDAINLTYLSKEKGYDLYDAASLTTSSSSNGTSVHYTCMDDDDEEEEDYGDGESITSISPDSNSDMSVREKEVVKTAMWSIGNVGLGHAIGYIMGKVLNRFTSSDSPSNNLQDIATTANDQGVGHQLATDLTTEAAQELTTEMAAEVTMELVSEAVIQTSTTATATTSASASASASSSVVFGMPAPPPPTMSGAELQVMQNMAVSAAQNASGSVANATTTLSNSAALSSGSGGGTFGNGGSSSSSSNPMTNPTIVAGTAVAVAVLALSVGFGVSSANPMKSGGTGLGLNVANSTTTFNGQDGLLQLDEDNGAEATSTMNDKFNGNMNMDPPPVYRCSNQEVHEMTTYTLTLTDFPWGLVDVIPLEDLFVTAYNAVSRECAEQHMRYIPENGVSILPNQMPLPAPSSDSSTQSSNGKENDIGIIELEFQVELVCSPSCPTASNKLFGIDDNDNKRHRALIANHRHLASANAISEVAFQIYFNRLAEIWSMDRSDDSKHSLEPTSTPTYSPSQTFSPSNVPTSNPTTALPTTLNPTEFPSALPTTPLPTFQPSHAPSFLTQTTNSGDAISSPGDSIVDTPAVTVSPETVAPTLISTEVSTEGTTPPSMIATTEPPGTDPPTILVTEVELEETLTPSTSATTVPPQTGLPTLTSTIVPTVLVSSTIHPTVSATSTSPSVIVSTIPTVSDSIAPSHSPSSESSMIPSFIPSLVPSSVPSTLPSIFASSVPSSLPSKLPSAAPSTLPSYQPSTTPSSAPSERPSAIPSVLQSATPSSNPSYQPSTTASSAPSDRPSATPSISPSDQPSVEPSISPSMTPSTSPSKLPTPMPSLSPSISPSQAPSLSPSYAPSLVPSYGPTSPPSSSPSFAPTTSSPSVFPSTSPSTIADQPSIVPTASMCTFLTVGGIVSAGNTMQITLQNPNPTANDRMTLWEFSLTWPVVTNGNLNMVELDGSSMFSTSSPPPTVADERFSGNNNIRSVDGNNAQKTLVLTFDGVAMPSSYDLQLTCSCGRCLSISN